MVRRIGEHRWFGCVQRWCPFRRPGRRGSGRTAKLCVFFDKFPPEISIGNPQATNMVDLPLWAHSEIYSSETKSKRERVLIIGTRFNNLYTAMDTPYGKGPGRKKAGGGAGEREDDCQTRNIIFPLGSKGTSAKSHCLWHTCALQCGEPGRAFTRHTAIIRYIFDDSVSPFSSVKRTTRGRSPRCW